VIGTLKLDEEESKHAGLADQNGFVWLSNFAPISEAGERHRKIVHLPNKSK
jgi:hypothetical protein